MLAQCRRGVAGPSTKEFAGPRPGELLNLNPRHAPYEEIDVGVEPADTRQGPFDTSSHRPAVCLFD